MTMTTKTTLRLRPEFEVIPLDGDAVLLRSPDQGVRVRVDGATARDVVTALRMLDGTRPLGAAFGEGGPRDGYTSLLRGLVARGIVDVDPPMPPASEVGRFFAQFHDDAAGCAERLGTSRVVVLGCDPIARDMVRELRTAGV